MAFLPKLRIYGFYSFSTGSQAFGRFRIFVQSKAISGRYYFTRGRMKQVYPVTSITITLCAVTWAFIQVCREREPIYSPHCHSVLHQNTWCQALVTESNAGGALRIIRSFTNHAPLVGCEQRKWLNVGMTEPKSLEVDSTPSVNRVLCWPLIVRIRIK